METPNKLSPNTSSFYWKKSDPAPELEMQSFWKKLRHFYRTGKHSDSHQESFSSALLRFLDDKQSAYPFTLEGNSKKAVIELEEKTPFYFLDFMLSELHQEHRKAFKGQLASLITGLNKLLQIEDKDAEVETLKGDYDFANELIAFDQMADMIPKSKGEELSQARSSRLISVIGTLKEGLELFGKHEGIVLLEKEVKKSLEKAPLFQNTLLIETKDDVFEHCQKLFQKEVKSFTSLMKAYRIAKLEIEGEYQEDIHKDYFEDFNWYRLLAEELKLFYPIVVVVNQPYVFDHLSSLSSLMASNKPIKVVVLNHEHISTPNQELMWEDASHQFRQEVAALAMAHRNVYTFQSSMADPSNVHQGLTNCFKSTAPGLCHLSVPMQDVSAEMSQYLVAKAANASRYFPAIQYDPAKGSKWGARFDLTDNIKAEESWPNFVLNANTSETEKIEITAAFTYADYKACFSQKVKELMIVPDAYNTDYLIPLSDYLELDEAKLYGKIPFIWLIDEENQLHRAAVPNVWVVSCQERLDFWLFLQELGGFNKAKDKEAIQQKEREMTLLLEEQKAKMDQANQQISETAQEEATSKAVERLVKALLNDEEL
ncbi:hypothetical protein SAMN05661096_00588 [Marivirga sericea]|uniref:Uncharacterized protein n=1 Tax=Marivirga sericea TaxID=1028 RepID=A0A1X7IFD5_9BACT|nr:hypothetical protein [Marivirga sericea]SMG13319.1 hypothetical protein SAMN05661096_00588 [Marivirga sericea]